MLGRAETHSELFSLLATHGFIPPELAPRLRRMDRGGKERVVGEDEPVEVGKG
jgi:hypothetical protein